MRLQLVLQLPVLALRVPLYFEATYLTGILERVEAAASNLQRRCRAGPLVVAKRLEIDDAQRLDKERN